MLIMILNLMTGAFAVSSHRSKRRDHLILSTLSVQIQTERATLMVKPVALKEKHDLEEKEEQLNCQKEELWKKKEILDLHTKLAAIAAKMLRKSHFSLCGWHE